MILTELEKEYINKIENEELYSFTSFVYFLAKKKSLLKKDTSLLKERFITFEKRSWDPLIDEEFVGYDNDGDILDVKAKIFTLATIIKTLEDHKYIYKLTLLSRTYPAFLKMNPDTKKYELEETVSFNDVIFTLKDTFIYPTPLLTQFIKNGYCTSEEIKEIKDEKERKKNLKVTIYIAMGTIIISSILNYFTYTNQREVRIINSEPTKIEIKSVDSLILEQLKKIKINKNLDSLP